MRRHLAVITCEEFLSRADRIVSGRDDLLGLAVLTYGSALIRQLDLLSGHSAAMDHWSCIPCLDHDRIGRRIVPLIVAPAAVLMLNGMNAPSRSVQHQQLQYCRLAAIESPKASAQGRG
jgi:hypothetical protein